MHGHSEDNAIRKPHEVDSISLILGPDMHRDLRGFCLFNLYAVSNISKKIRSNAAYLIDRCPSNES
jgi:hypothetical protein